MTDFRDSLRAELVAAAARPLPRRHAVGRPVLVRGAAVALAVVAAVLAIVVLPWGPRHAPAPAMRATPLPGQPLFGGSLDPGVRYATRALQPQISFRVSGDRWFVYDATSPTSLFLQRREGNPAKGTELPPRLFLGYFRMPRVTDPGTGAVRPAPDDLVGWLRSNPNLGITAVTRTQLFGHPATRLAVHIPTHPMRVDANCGFAKVTVASQPPAVATCAAMAPDVALATDSAGYLIVPDGADPLIVVQLSLVPARVGEIVRDSAPLLASTLIAR
jgi:hypothetical protein